MEAVLVHGEGDQFGQPFRLEPFQRRFIWQLYEYNRATRRRTHRRALLGLPKGNGKTELLAAIGLAELAGPFAPVAPTIPVDAASFEQADLLFGTARIMAGEGALKPHLNIFDTEILLKGKPGRLYRVAAAAGTNDGQKPTCFIADELHEWTGNKERVHLILSNGLAKRAEGLELNISTAGGDKDTLLGRLYEYGKKVRSGEIDDPGFLFEWWEAAETWDLTDEDQLRQALIEANPAAGAFLDIETRVTRWRDLDVPEYEYRRYFLNQWAAAPERWIAPEVWNACHLERNVPDGTPIVLGFDGSATRDNTALIGCTLEDRPHIFTIGIWERDPRDPRWQVPREEVRARIEAAMKRWKVRNLAMDPAGWFTEMAEWRAEWGDEVVLDVPQVNERMAPAADNFRTAVLGQKLSHDGNVTLARNVGNANTRETRWGLSIRKDHKDSPRKIDAAVAAVIAYDEARRIVEPPRRGPAFFSY
jgi:phage terminase large subunit-like protein